MCLDFRDASVSARLSCFPQSGGGSLSAWSKAGPAHLHGTEGLGTESAEGRWEALGGRPPGWGRGLRERAFNKGSA